MSNTFSAETLFSMPKACGHQFTIICDDPFLAHFCEKTIRAQRWPAENAAVGKHTYQQSQHLAISASLLSQDMFSETQAHILTIKGTDLKHPPLVQMIRDTAAIPIIFLIEKLTPAQKKTQGFIALSKQTTTVTTKALSEKKAMTWFQGLLKFKKIQIAPRLIGALCQQLDWDLSSMSQLVEQMCQHGINQADDLKTIAPCILTTNQAPVFTLLDKLFSGDIHYCTDFFTRHQQADVLQKAYWLCMRRVQQYVLMQERMAIEQISAHMLLQQERIWPQLQKQYLRALSLPRRKLQNHYLAMCELEWILKGLVKLDFQDQTRQRLLALAQDLRLS